MRHAKKASRVGRAFEKQIIPLRVQKKVNIVEPYEKRKDKGVTQIKFLNGKFVLVDTEGRRVRSEDMPNVGITPQGVIKTRPTGKFVITCDQKRHVAAPATFGEVSKMLGISKKDFTRAETFAAGLIKKPTKI